MDACDSHTTPGELLFPKLWSRLQWSSSLHRPPIKAQTQMFGQTARARLYFFLRVWLYSVDRNSPGISMRSCVTPDSTVVNYASLYLWINISRPFSRGFGRMWIAVAYLKSPTSIHKKQSLTNTFMAKVYFTCLFVQGNHYSVLLGGGNVLMPVSL